MRSEWGAARYHTDTPQDIGVLLYGIREHPKDYERDLSRRTFEFALEVMDLLKSVPYTRENDVVRFQLAKSAASVGAKYEGSRRTDSPSDMRDKTGSALQHAQEASTWLRVMQRMAVGDRETIRRLITESGEIKTALRKIYREIEG
ncbi:MAG: four helix bundle protein [Fidelibacterota bacterium]